ncbi:PAS/PAC sensor protein [Clostridium sulfidigenes]|uniref:PAS/PAC sensor protein n=1 Tax=Clostridium sulfidigenes TaxID=318464 RepID=A0A084JCQ0_9CLOT|nr:[Fe-Fe] hydrogenase large subunit C-terminal domain-containing protein [Clostridium sulfidigenes]KEZ86734.1 PAS/PAC sensor protein [Clostridium sulfidigenes]
MQVMNFSSANCKNCYKCVRTCTVKAIEVLNDQAKIQEDRCIFCGHCLVVCPQNARHVLSDIDDVKAALNSNKTVVAQLAPAFRGVFSHPSKLITALRKLGFSYIEEVSIGAELVTQEYECRIDCSSSSEFITSCCPSIVMLIEKYYPELIPLVLPVSSPMVAHGKSIKNRYEEPYTVFIGPCVSKKYEALSESNLGFVDSVLTFDEIIDYIKENGIEYSELEDGEVDFSGTTRGDRYPVVGGILNAIRPTIDKKDLNVIRVHGLENCKVILEELKNSTLKNVCIELSACNESCLGGPGTLSDNESVYTRLQRIQDYLKTKNNNSKVININKDNLNLTRNFENKKIHMLTPKDDEIKVLLKQMGKYTKEDELNCGACGYNTCVEKAIAVYNGMSEVEMCVPYMRSLAENMNSEIFKNSPNALIIIDDNLLIKDINPSGRRMFLNCEKESIIGVPITEIIHDLDFKKVANTKKNILGKKVFYSKLDFHGYKSVIYIKNHSSLLITFTDITEEENRKLELTELKRKSIDVTQTIINKQMMVAQEIASLLGETTAETKVAILELKKVLEEED